MNSVILSVCRDFWPSPPFRVLVTAANFGGLCVKSAQWSFSDADSQIDGSIDEIDATRLRLR